jgi:hypothetical protein
MSDSVDAKVATDLTPSLLDAAKRARVRAQAATDAGVELRHTLVAILCAATAVEAATYWEASIRAPGWFEKREKKLGRSRWSAARRWGDSVQELTHHKVDYGQGLGQAVVNLFDDRNFIAHPRGLPDSHGEKRLFLPPDAKTGGRSPIRAHFVKGRAATHVHTATQAVNRLKAQTRP